MTRPPARRLAAIIFWTLIYAGVAAFVPAAYTAVVPLNCVQCHDAEWYSHEQSRSHGDVPCVDCHSGTDTIGALTFGARQVYSMAVPVVRHLERDSTKAYDVRCVSCHASLPLDTYDGIRIDHENCREGRACTDCHGGIVHGMQKGVWVTRYQMDDCLTCHSTEQAGENCDMCHEGRHEADRTIKGAWLVTHGTDWVPTHGMGQLETCESCHSTTECAECHGAGVPHEVGFFGEHGTLAQASTQQCESCHQTAYCLDCHSGTQMPHPQAFIDDHSALVEDEGDETCRNCHQQSDCSGCHVAHVHPGGPYGIGGRR